METWRCARNTHAHIHTFTLANSWFAFRAFVCCSNVDYRCMPSSPCLICKHTCFLRPRDGSSAPLNEARHNRCPSKKCTTYCISFRS